MPHAAVKPLQHRRAKQLRQSMTRAETLLWRYLKAHHVSGLGFRRQVPMQYYIADFVCHSARIVVEIDGESHDFAARQKHDPKRDTWFASQGYRVLRFTNDDVLGNLEGVMRSINDAALARLSTLPPSLSLPHRGGGNDHTSTARVAKKRTENVRGART